VIFDAGRRKTILRRGPGQSLGLRRSAVSLVSFICDEASLQPSLPQVFISNEHVLTKADMQNLNSACARNVFFIRRNSSWVNVAMLLEILELLRRSLGQLTRTHSIVLHMDACRTHLHPSIVKACTRAGIYLMYIPASTTGWLQPLDVCVFSRYKDWVARELEQRRLATATGSLSRADVLDVYARGIPAVMHAHGWARAFELTGLKGQGNLSEELKKRLQWSAEDQVPSSLPSLTDLQNIYPAGAQVPIQELFELAVQREMDAGLPRITLRLPSRARLPALASPLPPLPPSAELSF
jgi:hypothetical protein